jgi:hypothetical protein
VIFDVLLRLEPDPHQRDLARGWAAELADPAWLLGRQWQMGEHQAEDASSPVSVQIAAQSTPIGAVSGQEALDPTTTPAQAIIESEPYDWWTIGRRVRIGRAIAHQAHAHGVTLPSSVALAGLPVPYKELNGTAPDGRTLWQQRETLDLEEEWFGTPGPPRVEPVDLWNPAELSYSAELPAANATLAVTRHDGGDLDWFHADASAPVAPGTAAPPISTIPGRLRYPSAPLPRWWQIEDAHVSIGGEAPDRAAVATLVLIDLIVNHSDDWFTFSLSARAGEITTLTDVTVTDDFGDSWPLAVPTDWSLFGTTGLAASSIVLWATARTPLAGPILDDIVLGMDEDANLVWAVEQVVAGETLATPLATPEPTAGQGDPRVPPTYSYLPMTPIPHFWHPYVIDPAHEPRRFVQGRAADLSGKTPTLMPPPVSDLLADPKAPPGGPVHQLEPSAIPSDGLRVRRRAMLARSTSGEPVLWTQRRRDLLLAPPTFALRFDVLRQDSVSQSTS